MKKLLKWIFGIILVIPTTVLVLLALTAVLVFTHVGLTSSLWAVQKVVPELKVGSTEGSLLPGFTLNNVEYINPDLGVTTHLKQLSFEASIDCLFDASVCIDTVSIDGLKFSMPSLPETTETAEEEPSSGLSTILVPIPVTLKHLYLNDIDLDVLGNKVSWQQFSTGLYVFGNTLTIDPTVWRDVNIELAQTPDKPEPPQTPNTLPLSQRPDIELPEISLPIGIALKQFDLYNFTLKQETPVVINHLGLQAIAEDSDIKVSHLKLDMPEVDLALDTEVTLANDYPLSLQAEATAKIADYQGQTITLNANGSVADLTLSSELSGGAVAKLSGNIQPLKATLPFDLSLEQAKAQWPLKGESDYQIAIKQLDAKGSLEGYELAIDTQLAGNTIPAVDLTTMAHGDLEQISLERLNINTLGGNIAGQAMVNWQAPLNWSATLGLTDIQPGLQWPQAEGKISGSIVNSGSLTPEGGWEVHLPTLNIKGVVRDYPLIVKGKLSANDSSGSGNYSVHTPGLLIAHAGNGLRLKGKLDKQWAMDVDVDMPSLSKSLPLLKGQIKGDMQLRGKQTEPKITTNLAVNNIDWNNKEATLQSLTLKGNVSPLPAPSGNIELNAKNGQFQKNKLQTLSLKFDGSEQSHQLSLDAITDIVSTNLRVQGGLKQNVWQGQLQAAHINLTVPDKQMTSAWSIDHPVDIEYSLASQVAQVQAHCWVNSPTQLCLDKDLTAGSSGEANVSIQHFTFNQIKPFMPEGTVVDGEVNVTTWAKWSPDAPPQVKFDLDIPSGKVTQRVEPPVNLNWDSVHVSADLKQNKLAMNWLLDLTSNGKLEGQLEIPNVQAKQVEINGKNTIDTIHLGFLKPLLGDQNDLQAEIQSDINFNGPVLQPKLTGNFEIKDLQLEGQMFPTDVTYGEMNTQFNGYSATLNSELNTPDGKLTLKGDANWAQLSQWTANLNIFGDELKVEVPPMIALTVQPDLSIAITPTLARISGEIDIPWGEIVVESLPESAVGLSSDEVILDDKMKPMDESSGLPMALEMDVKVNIGDEVSLAAFGLEGDLNGTLNITQKNDSPFILGEIRIEDGTYQSFGQDLIIEEGKIIMTGPADKPYVSIKAVRNPDNTEDDVEVGIEVTGPADNPTVTVFSDPTMAQSNALSYLLRGRGLDDSGGGSSTLTMALIGLSLAKSGKVVGQIGEAFGVQDLQVGTAGSGDDSQVTVSGYVAPGLQVKYGVGIFNALGEFSVRYELFTNFYVEAVTGLDSAVDFIYQFSFN